MHFQWNGGYLPDVLDQPFPQGDGGDEVPVGNIHLDGVRPDGIGNLHSLAKFQPVGAKDRQGENGIFGQCFVFHGVLSLMEIIQ